VGNPVGVAVLHPLVLSATAVLPARFEVSYVDYAPQPVEAVVTM
jgi:hypothetical protein